MELLYGKYLKSLENEVFRRIEKLLKDNARAYVIVPSQAKFLMESQILERCGVAGFMMLQVISFEKLTDYILSKVNGRAIPRIDSVGLSMLIREILAEISEQLCVLDAEKDDTLHEAISKLILALRTEDISPEDLLDMAEKRQGSIADKLRDIAAVYARLQEYHAKGIWDMNRAEDHAREYIGAYKDICGAEIIIHGFDIIPASRIRTVAALLKAGCKVTVTLEADEEDDVFARQLRTMYALEAAARAGGSSFVKTQITENVIKSPEILHIEENLYRYPTEIYDKEPECVHVVKVKDRREEIIHAAQIILESTREMKLSDIAILAADPKRYMTAIAEVFPKAGISWFFENKRSLREHRLATFVLSAAGIIAEGRWQDMPHLIKTGLLPIDDEQGDELLRYAAEHGKKPGAYRNQWKTAPTGIEEIRRRATEALLDVHAKAQDADAAEFAVLLAEYIELIGIKEDIALEEEMLRDLGRNAEAQFAGQVYERMMHILSQAQSFAHGIPKRDLRAMLETGFRNTEIAVVPQSREQVSIGDITHSIFPQKKLMIILGANDGVLTSRMDGGLFSEREVEELSKDGFFPGYISIRDQRLFLRRAFTSSDRLEIIYNMEDGPEAMAIHRLKRIFPRLSEQSGKTLRTVPGLLNDAVRELRLAAEGRPSEYAAVSQLIADEEGRDRLAHLVSAAAGGNTAKPLTEETAKRIYENTSNNVSRIEMFYRCPYKQFIEYGLKPQIARDFEEDALNAGIYVHTLIETVSKKLSKRGLADLGDAEIRSYIDTAAEAMHDTHNRGIFSESMRFSHIEQYLKEEVFYALSAIRDQLVGTGIAIDGTEREFGGKNLLEIDTPAGKVQLKGKIDRIDLLEQDGKRMVRVVDYKTGTPDPPSMRNIERGTTLQLITYLIAVLSIYENAVPAGANYMKVRLGYHKNEEELKKNY
ncbi:MAG: PD-(D/E)XK nuclease family protein, partial [Christensenellaceae bacterium]|nr:PD-(D/E)XK nuclease family protein [Christensenellaceae bacterium]